MKATSPSPVAKHLKIIRLDQPRSCRWAMVLQQMAFLKRLTFQHIGNDNGNRLPPFYYLKAPSYPSYLSFPFSHLFCPALSPTHRPHRFPGNPGWLAPGTQLCLKKSPTAKHYGKQQTVGMVRVGDRLQNSTTGRFSLQPITHTSAATHLGVSDTPEVRSGLSPSALRRERSIQPCDRTQCDTTYGLAGHRGYGCLGCSFSPQRSHSRWSHRGPLEKKKS